MNPVFVSATAFDEYALDVSFSADICDAPACVLYVTRLTGALPLVFVPGRSSCCTRRICSSCSRHQPAKIGA